MPRFFRWVLVLIVYLITFSALDQLSRTLQVFPGVVAWYPPDGVSLAFLLTFGAGFTPVFALASLISSLITYRFSTPLGSILAWAVILPVVYGLDVVLLRRRVRIEPQLKDLRDTLWLILSSAIVSTVLAVVAITGLVKFGTIPSSQYFNAFVQWWIGEMIGVMVFTPFLLVYVTPWLKRFIAGGWANSRTRIILHRPSLQSIGQVISIPVILYVVFGIPALRGFEPYYLIAGPLIWIALKNGFSKISLAIVAMNFGTILAIWLFKFDISGLGELQFLLVGIYASTLLTGAIVTRQKRTEEELRHSEVRNRALIENAPDAIILLGADGLLKYLSPSAQRILGYGPQEWVGSNPEERTHPEDLPALRKLLDDLSQKPGKAITTQYRIRHKDGSWRWLESTLTNLLAEPSVQAVVINFRDVTERKQADETLQRSEKRFRALVEHSLEEISLVDPDGTLTYESPTSQRPLGYPPNSFVGNNLFDLFNPDERAAAAGLLEQVVKHPGSSKEAVFRLRHQDGSWRWMEGVITNLLDEPAVQSVVINYRDITERKMAEAERNQSEALFRALFELSPDSIVLIDPHDPKVSWPIIDCNKAACLINGYSRDELIGQSIDILNVTSGPQAERIAYMKQLREAGKLGFEVLHRRKNGSIFLVEVSTTVFTVGGRELVLGIDRDITLRKQAEEEIKISNAELSMLFELSHALAEADTLEGVFELVNRHAVESIHSTFARIALLEDGRFSMRAAYPIRVLEHDLRIGERHPVTSLPYSQQVLEQKKPMILRAGDPGISSEEKKVLLLDFAQTLCLIPLRIGDSSRISEDLMGLLMLGEARNEVREPFTLGKLRLAQTIGDSAAIAIRRMLLHEQTERHLQQLMALSEIDRAISSTFDLQLSLGVLLQQVSALLGADATDVLMFNPHSHILEFSAGRGFRTRPFEHTQLRSGEGYAGQAALKRQIIHIPDLAAQHDNPRLEKHLADEQFVSYYGVPLIAKGEIKGVLEIFQRGPLEPDKEWLDFLGTLAGQAAIAIDSVMQFDNVQRSNSELSQAYDATIQGWSRALDLRDNETEGHTQRVAELTMALGRRFGLSEEALVHVRRGALLHDIGKMGVPDGILLKPGPLTDEEWILMRKHTNFAYELLSPIDYLRPAVDIPYCHHEKWDGKGYPRGLSGNQIPFAARIFAVVDVWDALTSDRPYRAAWSEERTLEYIRSLAGTQFDPQIVKVCLESGLLRGPDS